jgi:FkbM family methyltransferase
MKPTSALFEYLAERRAVYEQLLERTADGVLLYGAGFIGGWAIRYFKDIGVPVRGFLDSNATKVGQTVGGVPILSLSDLNDDECKRIVISARHSVREVRKALPTQLRESIMSVDEFVIHRTHRDTLELSAQCFLDDQSRDVFWSVVWSMVIGNVSSLASVATDAPYFHEFGFFNRSNEIFVDAGAYTGDSIERFIWSVNGSFSEIHAFEPGAVQYRALMNRVSRLKTEWALRDDQLHIHNCALSSSDEELVSFLSPGSLTGTTFEYMPSNSTANENLVRVRARTLDSHFGSQNITLLKADVEGSEERLIAGGRKLLERCLPRLVIAVYHFPTDLFLIPKVIRSISSRYSFVLRYHSSQLMDTFLYCTPEREQVNQ